MTADPAKPPLPRRTPQATAPDRAPDTLIPPDGLIAPDKIKETVEARDALAAALTTAGIQLPSLDVRTPWPITDDSDAGRATRHALIHLGVSSAPVALALAAVIVDGAGR
ncbi:hypothetical protein ACIBLA_10005 [Streptomyces sp. NPDC050433]|uniref:hypothetical protein n=1 Tax=Streptomyces sp. NPDC050433 TaxID=3365615 RepID=UPI0037AB4E68